MIHVVYIFLFLLLLLSACIVGSALYVGKKLSDIGCRLFQMQIRINKHDGAVTDIGNLLQILCSAPKRDVAAAVPPLPELPDKACLPWPNEPRT